MARLVSRSLRQDPIVTVRFLAHSQENDRAHCHILEGILFGQWCIGHRALQHAEGLVRTAMRLRFAHAGIPGEHSALLADPGPSCFLVTLLRHAVFHIPTTRIPGPWDVRTPSPKPHSSLALPLCWWFRSKVNCPRHKG